MTAATADTHAFPHEGRDVTVPAVTVGDRETVLVVGTYLGATVAVHGAGSFDDAWAEALEWICEHEPRMLPEADDEGDLDDSAEHVDGHGYRYTLDMVTYQTTGFER